jgi:hypothetical protein
MSDFSISRLHQLAKSFLKGNKVPFNLIKHNDSKPYRVVTKGIPPATPPKAILDELLALVLRFNMSRQ